jgi:putative membrane protein
MMRILKQGQLPILLVNVIALTGFSILFVTRQNYEFLIYVGVIIFFLGLILLTNHKVNLPNSVLWGLTAWALLHMAGGGLYIGDKKIYEIILIPLIGEPYHIFKYDQFVHIVGFGTATLVMYALLKPLLRENLKKWTALGIVVVMAGLGVGALNEIVEFLATVLVPETGVGGYINTSLDLVADLIGALGAIIYIRLQESSL